MLQPCYANSNWWKKPNEWFAKKSRSTTITGFVQAVEDDVITFKTIDGQELQLTGKKAKQIAEHKNQQVRVFGNVTKPNQKFPTGAIQVRNYKLLDESSQQPETPKTPTIVTETTTLPYEPEPYLEPQDASLSTLMSPPPAPSFQDKYDTEDDEDTEYYQLTEVIESPKELVAQAADKLTEYTVVSGDTLGLISQKVFGTSEYWREIAEFNEITNPSLLKVGMTLQIPENLSK